ncbi:hypothetical protein F5050DRAFT_1777744 [Lentinula boryana]|uniref:Mid2 domain-containing protein n=1 Tax=Lentinula boryana TaxID=40481 RepID=A0ABQ8Q642_9AGAR|nr:hypothetical protein F5050DRAFT_1777744 [Lentinula boryana]
MLLSYLHHKMLHRILCSLQRSFCVCSQSKMGRCPVNPFLLVLLYVCPLAAGLDIQVSQSSATVSVPITVTWSLSASDPTSFGLMEKDLDDGTISEIVRISAGFSSSGDAELTFAKTGQFVVQGIKQQSLASSEIPDPIGGAIQIGVVEASSTTSDSFRGTIFTPSITATISATTITAFSLPTARSSTISESGVQATSTSLEIQTPSASPESQSSSPDPDPSTALSSGIVPIPLSVKASSDPISSATTTISAPSSSVTSAGSSPPKGLSHKAKAITLVVIGIVFVLGVTLLNRLRKQKQRRRIAAFRERLAQIPGLSGLGAQTTQSSQFSSTEATSHTNTMIDTEGQGLATNSTRSTSILEGTYPFASRSSIQNRSTQMFF